MNALALHASPSVSRADALADIAADCLRLEVETAPKPGLVSAADSGSHTDMDIGTFRRSIEAVRPGLRRLIDAGMQGAPMARLRAIGLDTERAMLAATRGINTHRGAIFGLGLLCAAAGARLGGWAESAASLGEVVAQRWGRQIMDGPVLATSNGQTASRRYGVGGARTEASRGFPAMYGVGVSALREGQVLAPDDAEAARVHACFALIAHLDDTNLLHRGGIEGLRFAQQEARRFLSRGSVGVADWRMRAQAIHHAFVERRLSPGGAADLLAMSLFVQAVENGAS